MLIEHSPLKLKDWEICWEVKNAFMMKSANTPFPCVSCKRVVPAVANVSWRSFLLSAAVISSCNHHKTEFLCNQCDDKMLSQATFGVLPCFTARCPEVLRIDIEAVEKQLTSRRESQIFERSRGTFHI